MAGPAVVVLGLLLVSAGDRIRPDATPSGLMPLRSLGSAAGPMPPLLAAVLGAGRLR
ncbi:hypothetical protein ACIQU1_04280 [Streptomyces angustmyceticus]|uniref:hypothetical protein n=1 Tax=Streptomyces angustmyceticus TaxID=285578 RepID=UPI00382B3822